jgi:ribulose-5-phosphate 4-epimerase/fuculose-1-phosphate aldolase
VGQDGQSVEFVFEVKSETFALGRTAAAGLIHSIPLGAALAKTLDRTTLVMRGHGFTVTEANVREAVYNALNTVLNARVQMDTMRVGDVTHMSADEAAAVSKLYNASLDTSWEIWTKRAAGELP